MDGVGLPSSLGILRNVARLNRPDMGQLDREYRQRTEQLLNNQSRGEIIHQGSTPSGLDYILSTNKSSSFAASHTKPKKKKQTLQNTQHNPKIEKMGFDLDQAATDDVQRFMQE